MCRTTAPDVYLHQTRAHGNEETRQTAASLLELTSSHFLFLTEAGISLRYKGPMQSLHLCFCSHNRTTLSPRKHLCRFMTDMK